ncbi:MAG: PAS domain-containing sensor histidine kinase [Desulfuromonadales bacterium]|nr:PAS domain-containing sensor histidine kinase [Desulfuromonadales bacterium]
MTSHEPFSDVPEVERLRAENQRLQALNREAFDYIRAKVNDLLDVVGTRTLRPEELDNQSLVALDPIGIVATTFRHVLENVRETNRQLQMAHSEIQTIFDTVGSATLVVDRQRRIVSLNRQATKLLIGHDGDVIGQCCNQVLCEADPAPEECVFLQVMNSGREAIIRGRPLRGRFFDVIAAPICEEDGQILHVVMAYHDVTEARQVEKMKSEFVSTAAHELRSPLATIMGYADLLLNGPEQRPEQTRDYLGLILNRSEHLAHIVSDLLDISRIEAGEGLKLTFEPCRLDLLCREAAWGHEDASDRHPIEFDLPADGAVVEGDHYALTQILENLLSNAIKYSPQGGTIRIDVRNEPTCCELAVADHGMGMTSDQIEHVFEKFYRANTSNTGVPGTGLGMTIVKYLVDAHNGQIAIASTPGAGTTVRIRFPVKQPISE